jgi:hypothetical protein
LFLLSVGEKIVKLIYEFKLISLLLVHDWNIRGGRLNKKRIWWHWKEIKNDYYGGRETKWNK